MTPKATKVTITSLTKENAALRAQISALTDQVGRLTDMLSATKSTLLVSELMDAITNSEQKLLQLRPNALKVLNKLDPNEEVTPEIVRDMVKSITKEGCNNTHKVRLTTLSILLKKHPLLVEEVRVENATVRKQASEAIALTAAELDAFEKVKTTSVDENVVKDLFIISCYTGMRFSDVFKITPENITGTTITYTSEKTKVTASVSIPARIQKLIFDIQEFDIYNSSKQSMINKMNRILERLCERAWDSNINVVFKGGKRQRKDRAKLVSTHTGRRTAATRWSRLGVDENKIQVMMGHSSVEQTRRYIKGYIDKDTELLLSAEV